MEALKYWAFISYSHQDRAWGDWLHKTLETYRVPARLVGRASRDGTTPARLYPIFRDRDELPSSANLGDAINESLRQSRYQIVICSPRAAASRWVNEEVKYFKSLGREDRVLCLIVAGEPNVINVPGRDIEECFCPALRYPAEPIAADAREHADGKRGALLKLISGLIGVGLDELIQRERQRRLWKRVQTIALACVIAGVIGGITQWFVHQRADREREITIERIVESGRQELLEGHQARAAVFLNQAYKMGYETVPLRFMLAQAMKPVEALSAVRVNQGGLAAYRAAAFSEDGNRFVLGSMAGGSDSGDALAKVYDSATGALQVELRDSVRLPVMTRFFDGGRRLLVTGYPDERAEGAPVSRIWSFASPGSAIRLSGFNGISGEPMDRNGTGLLIVGAGVEVRDSANGGLLTTFAKSRNTTAATYAPDGKSIAFADDAGIVEIVSAADGRSSRRFSEAAGQTITGLLFTPDGAHLLAVSSIGDLHNWDVAKGQLQVAFAADPDKVMALRLDRTGARLLTIGAEGFKVWSIARGSLLFSIPRVLSGYASAALSPDGDTLILADDQSNVAEAWDVRSKTKLYSLDLHNNTLSGVAFQDSGERLLLASRDGQAEIWRMPVTPDWKYQSFSKLPFMARFSRDGQQLLAGGGDFSQGSAMVFDLRDGNVLREFSGHRGVIYDVAFDPVEDLIATASHDGTAGLWDAKSGARIATLDHRSQEVASARFSADGERILTSTSPLALSRKDAAGLWDGHSGQLIAWLDHDDLVQSAEFDPAGSRVVTAGHDKLARIWAARDGHLLRTLAGHEAWVVSATFSQDGHRVLTASEDNSVRVWDADSGLVLDTFSDPGLGVPTVAVFSPDGQTIAVATESGVVWLWSPRSGTRQALKEHRQLVNGVRFTTDGALLFSYGYDGTARAWDVRKGVSLGVVAVHDRPINHLDLDATSGRIATSAWGQIAVSSVRPEARTADVIARILICHAPWRFDEAALALTPSAPDSAACAGARQ